MISEIFDPTQDLIERKAQLAKQTHIPDMAKYAQQWADLSAAYEFCSLWHNAADCKARAIHYYTEYTGAYTRAIDASIAELRPAQPAAKGS